MPILTTVQQVMDNGLKHDLMYLDVPTPCKYSSSIRSVLPRAMQSNRVLDGSRA
jgi:hypothetical protein